MIAFLYCNRFTCTLHKCTCLVQNITNICITYLPVTPFKEISNIIEL